MTKTRKKNKQNPLLWPPPPQKQKNRLSSGCGDGGDEVLEIVADGTLPGSVRRLVEVEGDGASSPRFSSRALAVPGVGPALGGGSGGFLASGDNDGDGKSAWRLWAWLKGQERRAPPPPPAPVAVSAAA